MLENLKVLYIGQPKFGRILSKKHWHDRGGSYLVKERNKLDKNW